MMAALSSCNRSWYWISGWDWSWATALGEIRPGPTTNDFRPASQQTLTCIEFFECEGYRGATSKRMLQTFWASSVLVNLQFLGRCWPAAHFARRQGAAGQSAFYSSLNIKHNLTFLPSTSCFMPSAFSQPFCVRKMKTRSLCTLSHIFSSRVVRWWGLFGDLHNWCSLCSLTTLCCAPNPLMLFGVHFMGSPAKITWNFGGITPQWTEQTLLIFQQIFPTWLGGTPFFPIVYQKWTMFSISLRFLRDNFPYKLYALSSWWAHPNLWQQESKDYITVH